MNVKVAPSIWKTDSGWRVFVRLPDPVTGRSRLAPKRFKDDGRPDAEQIEDLKHFRDAAKLEAKRARRHERRRPTTPTSEPTFTADADRYLALDTVKAMPAFVTRDIEMAQWKRIFGDRIRRTITAPQIDQELQRLRNDGYSGSTVNKFRTALMSLWTQLDGRSAANPVKDTAMFDEAEMTARGQSYDVLTAILDMIPDERGLDLDRERFYREVWRHPMTTVATRYEVSASFLARICTELNIPRPPRGYWTTHRIGVIDRAIPPLPPAASARQAGKSPQLLKARARLEVLAWTGMEPKQLGRMMPDHVNVAEKWYITPQRAKGSRRRRTPRPVVKKPMSPEATRAFQHFIEQDAWGEFCAHSLRKAWLRGCARFEREMQKKDRTFKVPHIRLKDLRHSFGTQLWKQTKGNEAVVGQMLDHAPGSPMTRRYALGAVPSVLRAHMQKFRGRKVRRSTTKRGAA